MRQNIEGQGELFDIKNIVLPENSKKSKTVEDINGIKNTKELPADQRENTQIRQIKIGENNYDVQENYGVISVFLKNTYRGLFRVINNEIKIDQTINYISGKNSHPVPKNILAEMYKAVGVFNKIKLVKENN